MKMFSWLSLGALLLLGITACGAHVNKHGAGMHIGLSAAPIVLADSEYRRDEERDRREHCWWEHERRVCARGS
jgi:hypothetical protein